MICLTNILKVTKVEDINKIKLFIDRLRGVDFTTPPLPKVFDYDSKTVFRSSPSGDNYLVQLLKKNNSRNINL